MAASQPSTAARVRGLFADVFELAQVRLELFTVEAREEISRLAAMAVFGALAVVLMSFGIIFLALFITVMLWDSQRLLALGICTAVFLGGGGVLAMLAVSRAKQATRMFAATRDELRRDADRLRA